MSGPALRLDLRLRADDEDTARLACPVSSSWETDDCGAVRRAGRKRWGPPLRPRPRPEAGPRADGLSVAAVQEIRRRVALGTPRRALAEEIGVSYGTIVDVAARRSWAHVPDGDDAVGVPARPDRTPKLDEARVIEIRRRVAYGEPRRAVAIAMGIAYGTVQNVVSRRIWAHVPDPEPLPAPPRAASKPGGSSRVKLDVARVLEIRRRAADGEYTKDLAVAFGVSPATISAVRMRRIWADVPDETAPVRQPMPKEAWCQACSDWHSGGCP